MAAAPTANRRLVLAGGNADCTVQDAARAIGAYAFALTDLQHTCLPKGAGPSPVATKRARWSYKMYDLQKATAGRLTYNDLIVSIGLSSQLKEWAIAGMLEVMDEVSDELDWILEGTTFWGLPDVDHKTATPKSTVWRMWRAVELLDAVHGVGFTVAHKTLHHKRPELFPLLDNETVKYLPYKKSWTMIHDDLATYAAEFAALEKWFAGEAKERNGLPLTRLRMHDIIVWLKVKKQWSEAVNAGTELGF